MVIKDATTDYVMFLDKDYIYERDSKNFVSIILETNENVISCSSNYIMGGG